MIHVRTVISSSLKTKMTQYLKKFEGFSESTFAVAENVDKMLIETSVKCLNVFQDQTSRLRELSCHLKIDVNLDPRTIISAIFMIA